MNLLEGLSDLQGGALDQVLRRTILSALIVGAVAVLITALLGSPWALGLIVGLGMAILNLRSSTPVSPSSRPRAVRSASATRCCGAPWAPRA